jgi:hypothetical protein
MSSGFIGPLEKEYLMIRFTCLVQNFVSVGRKTSLRQNHLLPGCRTTYVYLYYYSYNTRMK